MTEKTINFDNKNISKSNFYRIKRLFKTDDIDVAKILISKKELYGEKNWFKYFLAFEDHDYIGPLCIKLLK